MNMEPKKEETKQQAQKTIKEFDEHEKKLNSLERGLRAIEAMNLAMMILFAITTFLLLISIASEYLVEILAKTVYTRTGQFIMIIFVLSSAIICISLIEQAVRQYVKEQKT